jgi:hypothetical protein
MEPAARVGLRGDHGYSDLVGNAEPTTGCPLAEVTLPVLSEARPPHEPLRSHGVAWLGAVTPGSDAIRGRRSARAVRGFPQREGVTRHGLG